MGKVKLIPPDKKRCQALILGGCRPSAEAMFIIGPATQTRCTSEPKVIVYENRPGNDGQKGSMSLCDSCLAVMIRQCGVNFATVKPINRRNYDRKRTN